MKNLTERQREVLNYISQFTDENVSPPTVREIGEHFGISLRAVQDHISALQKKGFITQTKKRSRSIRVVREQGALPSGGSVQVPLFTGLCDHREFLSPENFCDTLEIPAAFLSTQYKTFACHMPDDSLSGAGILKGDTAIFETTEKFEGSQPCLPVENISDGQIVITVMDSQILVRKFKKEPNRICLQPENSSSCTVYSQSVKVEGILKAILRLY